MSAPRANDVVTLGCRLNHAESERIAAMLGEENIVVVNSCAVTSEAVRSTRRAIRRLRRERPAARLLVTGCAADIERETLAAMPEVDALVPNAAKLDPARYGGTVGTPARPRHSRAFVPVQNGCDHACTFCVIPQGRGPSRSHAVDTVRRRVEEALDRGAREIVLTGVDVTSWGADLPGAPSLGTLVAAILHTVPDLPRLRLSSVDGVELDPQLLDLIEHEPRVMPHLHLSLQHGHDMMLKRMKRRHSRADAVALVARLKAARPELAIGADLIAGFPTESETMHAANRSIIEELDIVHAHVFPYSLRPGTPAARMPQLERSVVKARAAELREVASFRRAAWLDRLVGEPLTVLAERDGTGHSECFAPVALPAGTLPGALLRIAPQAVEKGMLR